MFKRNGSAPPSSPTGWPRRQARFPTVPIVFAETRPLAQEWTYRFLGAALAHPRDDRLADDRVAALPAAGAVPPAEPTTAEVRAWARRINLDVPDRGRLRPEVWTAWQAANRGRG